jgi:hypothetical protein
MDLTIVKLYEDVGERKSLIPSPRRVNSTVFKSEGTRRNDVQNACMPKAEQRIVGNFIIGELELSFAPHLEREATVHIKHASIFPFSLFLKIKDPSMEELLQKC